jgi:hypothetical protein
MLDSWWVIGMTANGRPDGSSLSATAQDRWEQTPNIVSGLEKTGPEDPFYESHTASQTCELLMHRDSGELPIEDSSPDEASGKP